MNPKKSSAISLHVITPVVVIEIEASQSISEVDGLGNRRKISCN